MPSSAQPVAADEPDSAQSTSPNRAPLYAGNGARPSDMETHKIGVMIRVPMMKADRLADQMPSSATR